MLEHFGCSVQCYDVIYVGFLLLLPGFVQEFERIKLQTEGSHIFNSKYFVFDNTALTIV